jgi:hypothetical protein
MVRLINDEVSGPTPAHAFFNRTAQGIDDGSFANNILAVFWKEA